jgi:hypothetical protein
MKNDEAFGINAGAASIFIPVRITEKDWPAGCLV